MLSNGTKSTKLVDGKPQLDEPSALGRMLLSNRAQLLGGLVLAVVLPLMLRQVTIGGPENAPYMPAVELYLATVGTFIALVSGYVVLRQLIRLPGTQAVSHIVFTFLGAYAVVIIIFFFLRIDYSRFQFLASFLLCEVWFLWVYLFTERTAKTRLAVVPHGAVDLLDGIGSVNLLMLEDHRLNGTRVDGVVADLRANLSDDWERFLAETALSGIPVYHVKQLAESLTGRVQIEALSENSLGSVLPSLFYVRFKRLIDLIPALLLLPVFGCVIFAAGMLVKLEARGPIFFVQQRMGYRGQPFNMIKIRTMVDGAPSQGTAFTAEDDPRITRIGRILRKYRIDEFPQILNIIRGEMSWIGPRPEAVDLSAWYEKEIPFYVYRHIVRPGLSGWAQVNQGNVAQIEAASLKLQYDFYYIKHLSPWLDLLIVGKTIRTMLTGFGSK